MELEIITLTKWDKELWARIKPIYNEAFPSGAKTERILHSMLDRGIGRIHAGLAGDRVAVMAVTGLSGTLAGDQMLVIDYLATDKSQRGQGLGSQMLEYLRNWAEADLQVRGIIIEVESGDTAEHLERIRFWERRGFILTPYVLQYIWVPEPYQAMILPLESDYRIRDDGESLFRYIQAFHKKAYRPR